MKIYRTRKGILLEEENRYHPIDGEDWDRLLNREDIVGFLEKTARSGPSLESLDPSDLLPPIGSQEVWAAGVTYYRSRDARMEEARKGGGSDFYDRVYVAPRPELFFKSAPHRVVGHGQEVRIRKDSRWNVPEPELTLVVNSRGKIIGTTAGNDMSSRDIEGENPLYLPQAKVYDGSCALGPGILVGQGELPKTTGIRMVIRREGRPAFEGSTTLSQMKRSPSELVEWLFLDNSFPHGCFLMTGTGVIPPPSFSLESRDEIEITIESVGTLVNRVA